MASIASSSSQQQYGTRNLFYLRVSPKLVLSCILYLDGRHVAWLNAHPSAFHTTLTFLKDRIMPKLEREAKVIKRHDGKTKAIWSEMSGKETVDVARRSEFHLAYFFKKAADSHGVLLKDKQYIFPGESNGGTSGKKRRRDDGMMANPEVDRSEDGTSAQMPVKLDPEEAEHQEDMVLMGGLNGDVHDESAQRQDEQPDGLGEDEDVKPKFKLRVRYNGFRIFQKCLIIVMEPSPSARARSPHLFASQQNSEKRQLSMTPALAAPSSTASRQRTTASRTPSVAPGAGRSATTMRDASSSMVGVASSSRRDASRTPLFRGSLTPSDVGDGDIGDSASPALDPDSSLMPPPPPQLARPSRSARPRGRDERMPAEEDTIYERGENSDPTEAQGDDVETDIDANGEASLQLAERMLFSQDGIANGAGISDLDQGAED